MCMCISNNKRDFPDGIQPLKNAKVDGIASHLQVEGAGNICWSMFDSIRSACDITLVEFLAPKDHQPLFSITVFCKHYPNNSVILNPKSWTIQPNPNQPSQHAFNISIHPNKNLPVMVCHQSESLNQLALNFYKFVTTMHALNFNLSKGVLATSHAMQLLHKQAANIPSHDLPKCAACQFGKQTNLSVPEKQTWVTEEGSGILSAKKTQPGQQIFNDHFECSTRGSEFKGWGIWNKQKNA